jgi:nucleoid-associated protein YgaU
MVAIQSSRESVEWVALPGRSTVERPGVERSAVERPAARRLPDRATRIRRRRLAVLVAAVVGLAGAALAAQALAGLTAINGSSRPQPVEVRSVPVAGQHYVVQPGDTLWSIAAEIAPEEDPRVVVDALRRANGGPELQIGSQLTLDID